MMLRTNSGSDTRFLTGVLRKLVPTAFLLPVNTGLLAWTSLRPSLLRSVSSSRWHVYLPEDN